MSPKNEAPAINPKQRSTKSASAIAPARTPKPLYASRSFGIQHRRLVASELDPAYGLVVNPVDNRHGNAPTSPPIARLQRLNGSQPGEQRLASKTPALGAKRVAATIDLTEIDSDEDLHNYPYTVEPSEELVSSFEALTLGSARLQGMKRLPFLRRNLRQGFRNTVLKDSLPSHSSQPERMDVQKLDIVLICDRTKYRYSQVKKDLWSCPLCRLFSQFETREFLSQHLKIHHKECMFTWKDWPQVTLQLMVPDFVELESDDSLSDSEEPFSDSVSSIYAQDPSTKTTVPEFLNRSPTPEQKYSLQAMPITRTVEARRARPRNPRDRSNNLRRSPTPEAKPLLFGSFVPNASSSCQIIPSQTSPRPFRPPRPIDPVDPERYPTPPPYDNLEGPSAVYPYLDSDSYSARPGGPKLYDLLNSLPLEPFGMLQWFIIDKEEEIFEQDDVGDEDKVIMALWARWITLNRTKFLLNYFKGTETFINEYWKNIHYAAGFAALRAWLLVLGANRFLTSDEACRLLSHYTKLTGMDLWK